MFFEFITKHSIEFITKHSIEYYSLENDLFKFFKILTHHLSLKIKKIFLIKI